MTDVTYEYAIMFTRYPDAIHRGPFTQKEAEDWIAEWIEDGGKPEVMYIVRRPTGEWEPVPDGQDEPATPNDMRDFYDAPAINYDSGSLLGAALAPKTWRVEYVTIRTGFDSPGEQALAEMLERGWEPFAVTVQETSSVTYTYHLRKQS